MRPRTKARGFALVCGFFVFLTTPSAAGWFDEVDSYVASLNSPEVKDPLGLKEARRSERIANRLEVIFEDHASPQQRSQILQQIGHEFLRVLFLRQFIPVAIVVERNASGQIVGSVIVKVSGTRVIGPEAVPQTHSPC